MTKISWNIYYLLQKKIYIASLLQKLVLPTTKSVGKSVWNGRYPQISHGFVPCVKTPWVNIFPREFPRALTIFPQILPWVIRVFNFPQISHKFPTVFNSHFPHISVVFFPQIFNDFHTTIFPTNFSRDFPRFLVAILIRGNRTRLYLSRDLEKLTTPTRQCTWSL